MRKLISAKLILLASLFLPQSAYAQAKEMTWPQSRMPIGVYIKQSKEVPGFSQSLAAAVKQAFDEWTMASAGKVSFIFLDKPDKDAKITVSWTNDRSKMQSSREDGQTTLIADGQGIVSADILLLTVPPPGMKVLGPNYFKHIALHEVGHSLGIAVHSAVAGDVMYGVIDPVDKAFALTGGDAQTLVALYTPNPNSQAASGQVSTATTGSASASVVSGTSAVTSGGTSGGTMAPSGDSPQLRAIRLNNEASMAMQAGQGTLALSKLEEALKLDPGNKLTQANLGLTYANLSTMAIMQRKLPEAESYARKAVPLVEQSGNKTNLFSVLRTYALILHMAGKEPEAMKIEAKMAAINGQK